MMLACDPASTYPCVPSVSDTLLDRAEQVIFLALNARDLAPGLAPYAIIMACILAPSRRVLASHWNVLTK